MQWIIQDLVHRLSSTFFSSCCSTALSFDAPLLQKRARIMFLMNYIAILVWFTYVSGGCWLSAVFFSEVSSLASDCIAGWVCEGGVPCSWLDAAYSLARPINLRLDVVRFCFGCSCCILKNCFNAYLLDDAPSQVMWLRLSLKS